MVVLILLMVSSIVAVGIPAAVRAYDKVVDSANAQVLLSTAMARLRDELGKATDVKLEQPSGDPAIYKAISYYTPDSNQSLIYLKAEGTPEYKVIYVQPYNNIEDSGFDKLLYAAPLVSDSASGKKLYVTYDSVSYSEGVVTFHGLVVKYKTKDQELTEVTDYKIRVLTDEE